MSPISGRAYADVLMVPDIGESLAESKTSHAPDVIVIVSGDRDLRAVIETARSRQKRVMLLTLPSSGSRLVAIPAVETRFLDLDINARIRDRLARDTTTDAPPPEVKKKKQKGK